MAPHDSAAYSDSLQKALSSVKIAEIAMNTAPPPPPDDPPPGTEQATAPDYSQAWAEYYTRMGWSPAQQQQVDPYASWSYQLSYGPQQSYLQQPAYGASDPAYATGKRSGMSNNGTGTCDIPAYPQQYLQPPQAYHTADQAYPPWQREQQLPSVSQATPAPAHALTQAAGKPLDYSAINAAAKRPFAIRPQMSNKFKSNAAQRSGAGIADAPAYVTIASAKPPASTVKRESAAGGSQGWPEALRLYVQRAFQHCQAEPDREGLQEVLKRIITDAQASGEIWTRDWASMPMPTLAPDVTPRPQLQHTSLDASSSDSSSSEDQYRARVTKRKAVVPSPASRKPYLKKAKKVQQQVADATPNMKADTLPMSYEERQRLKERAGRFGSGKAKGAVAWKLGQAAGSHKQRLQTRLDIAVEGEDIDWDSFVVRGTCQEVEKSYFRLTAKPDPASVRPEPVLWKALDRLVTLLRTGKPTYFYASDQFKGMRQDCTVQHLRNELAVRLYEAHARSALEYGDIGEYNQCQTQLIAFYAEGLPGCREEFLAYRILYQTVHVGQGEGAALLGTLQAVSPEAAQHPAVAHALQVRQAVCVGDHTHVCKLYSNAPNMGRALLDVLFPKLRFGALRSLVQAFKPTLPIAFLASQLGFLAADNQRQVPASPTIAGLALPGCTQEVYLGKYALQGDEAGGIEACAIWLQKHGAVLGLSTGVPAVLDCKASAGRLAIPQDTSAVAHGDANLDVNDFLAHALKV